MSRDRSAAWNARRKHNLVVIGSSREELLGLEGGRLDNCRLSDLMLVEIPLDAWSSHSVVSKAIQSEGLIQRRISYLLATRTVKDDFVTHDTNSLLWETETRLLNCKPNILSIDTVELQDVQGITGRRSIPVANLRNYFAMVLALGGKFKAPSEPLTTTPTTLNSYNHRFNSL